ncbi:hydantoinase B/oxoprolinase family protein [Cronbergia sp. UHCC 0137]|uniref:hydantoinase B/oxoprolinase family protein n=1 Tax=Cronbergia sp. UHCC 0137 TaxID=3110239 RepID=UPI002B21264A|nr:hydantoinase B/oxoprolinase family protein [Cronbergia sp. UHCC 0137]MEA5619788.1 hydantoinase B/oxoprolinase family protein [Cronbergia sp. UHCC 0137]
MTWEFWIDRGGTFTDIVAKSPNGKLVIHKLLSENSRYTDAAIQGIREILAIPQDEPIPSSQINVVKMGTTVATNALLEKKGDSTLLIITQGFADALRIGYQNRPDIFARHIILPEMLYEQVIEVTERYSSQGEELISLNLEDLRPQMQRAFEDGIRACAIVFMHGYRYTSHEKQVANLAQEIGFTQISASHQVSPLMKLVSRGDTTVVDAYLSPILRRYVDQVASQLGNSVKLMFMQSNGGLVDAENFQGKDSILSGPAGGIVGAVQTSLMAGFKKLITFDMGGTSTDVAHYDGEYERSLDTEVAGIRLRTPMMAIHTVAAGGGSILQFDGSRYRVGPQSAGANPGPASYSQGGPLTVTDCNVMVGKLQPGFFPQVFGVNGDLPLNAEIVRQKFRDLTDSINDHRTPEEVATGFLAIAVDKMANAIKKISLQRGYDISTYTLCCFGGAGGQHACLIADALGMTQVFIHPLAGVLSAYGMGLANVRVWRERAVEAVLDSGLSPQLTAVLTELAREAATELNDEEKIEINQKVLLRYEGTDVPLMVNFADMVEMQNQFEELHRQRYGFIAPEKRLIVEAVTVELVVHHQAPQEVVVNRRDDRLPEVVARVQMYTAGKWWTTPVYQREDLQPGDCILGPAIIVESTGTNVIEPGWQAELTPLQHLVLQRSLTTTSLATTSQHRPDPVMLEIFNNLFRAIAQQMGITLQNTSSSVNIKERLDFSCAIFDHFGQLIANAPHIPVHLGSMSESVEALITSHGDKIKPGDVFAANNPYNGGTHLPDITVITPVFSNSSHLPIFYVASRGHHADIGGITPGSMPPHSQNITEEGILLDNFPLVVDGKFCEQELVELLTNSPYPARNINQNIADLKAQIAANEQGVKELNHIVEQYSLETVQAYMRFVQDNAEEAVRRVIEVLKDGNFSYNLDNGSVIQVDISIDRENRNAKIDFTGTSPQQLNNNFNAPAAVCKAAVLYVFRTLVDDDIPLNAGCMKPLEVIIPENCMLNPRYPAAVVAGNVETSQAITDALYGALGVLAASQGTMNNFTFGNERYQYYETICGGSGAGAEFDGTDAVQTHMTNSRLTDPEVLEWRFPVILESFKIRENSGGKGKHHGGNGVIRRLRFLEKMTAGILANHRLVAPFGLSGGEPGKVGRNYVERCNGDIEDLPSKAVVEMNPGDVFIVETPGGGGYG